MTCICNSSKSPHGGALMQLVAYGANGGIIDYLTSAPDSWPSTFMKPPKEQCSLEFSYLNKYQKEPITKRLNDSLRSCYFGGNENMDLKKEYKWYSYSFNPYRHVQDDDLGEERVNELKKKIENGELNYWTNEYKSLVYNQREFSECTEDNEFLNFGGRIIEENTIEQFKDEMKLKDLNRRLKD